MLAWVCSRRLECGLNYKNISNKKLVNGIVE